MPIPDNIETLEELAYYFDDLAKQSDAAEASRAYARAAAHVRDFIHAYGDRDIESGLIL